MASLIHSYNSFFIRFLVLIQGVYDESICCVFAHQKKDSSSTTSSGGKMVAITCAAETTIECKQLSAEIFDR